MIFHLQISPQTPSAQCRLLVDAALRGFGGVGEGIGGREAFFADACAAATSAVRWADTPSANIRSQMFAVVRKPQ